MTTPPETEGIRHDHRCQTKGCPNDFVIITLNVDTSDANYLCWGCNVAFQIAIIQRMAANGDLPGMAASVTSSALPAPSA